jgi:cytochrome c biogenesis protein CcdA
VPYGLRQRLLTDDITVFIVLGTAIVDAVNPCAIGVLLFLSSVLLKASEKRAALLQLGLVYIATVYVVYALSGLGLIWFQHAVGLSVAGLIILLGLVELKDVFWYGTGLSLEISPRNRERLTSMVMRLSLLGVTAIGAFVALVELPCTGGPYLAITTILARSFDARAFLLLLLYNLIFVAPLVAILFMIYFGSSTMIMKRWRQENRRWMNLASGLVMIGLGVFLIGHYRLGWFM